jgi:hypothetical protein
MAIIGVECNIVIPIHCHLNRFVIIKWLVQDISQKWGNKAFVGKSNRNRPFVKSWNTLDKWH